MERCGDLKAFGCELVLSFHKVHISPDFPFSGAEVGFRAEVVLLCWLLTIIFLLTVPCNKNNKLFKPGPPIEVKYMN